jgi:hypothetical protein
MNQLPVTINIVSVLYKLRFSGACIPTNQPETYRTEINYRF